MIGRGKMCKNGRPNPHRPFSSSFLIDDMWRCGRFQVEFFPKENGSVTYQINELKVCTSISPNELVATDLYRRWNKNAHAV